MIRIGFYRNEINSVESEVEITEEEHNELVNLPSFKRAEFLMSLNLDIETVHVEPGESELPTHIENKENDAVILSGIPLIDRLEDFRNGMAERQNLNRLELYKLLQEAEHALKTA